MAGVLLSRLRPWSPSPGLPVILRWASLPRSSIEASPMIGPRPKILKAKFGLLAGDSCECQIFPGALDIHPSTVK